MSNHLTSFPKYLDYHEKQLGYKILFLNLHAITKNSTYLSINKINMTIQPQAYVYLYMLTDTL